MSLARFELERMIGAGAAGVVWSARDRESGQAVAIKIVGGDGEAHQVGRSVEARVAASLAHRNIMRILDLGVVTEGEAGPNVSPGMMWMAMPLAQGGTLRSWQGQVPWSTFSGWIAGMLEGLAHAHARGIWHRDLKPDNILLLRDASGAWIPVVSDFGMSRVAESGPSSGGSAPYMSPEQRRGAHHLEGPWSDLYALGALCWEFVSGQLPAVETSALVSPMLTAEIAGHVEAWLKRCLDPSPSARFASAAAAHLALFGRPLRWSEPRRVTSWSCRHKPALVGRQREMDVLLAGLEHVRESGEARAIVVEGPSGMGRSRLVRRVQAMAHQLGWAVSLHASHASQPSEGDGIRGMIRRHLGVSARARLDLQHAQIAERLSLWGGMDLQEAADLARLVGGGGVSEARRHALARRVVARGQQLAVIRLDDADRDAGTLRFAQYLLEQGGPYLVVIVIDPASLDEVSRSVYDTLMARGAQRVSLQPLNEATTDALLDSMGVSAERRAPIVSSVGGHPGAAVAAAHDVMQGLTLLGDEARGSESARWSARARGLWERVSPRERGALSTLAALGPEVDTLTWADATRVIGGEVTARLQAALLDRGLAVVDGFGSGRRWRVNHPEVRASWEAAAPDVAELHRACARVLVDLDPVGRARRARHVALAGDLENAEAELAAVWDVPWRLGDVATGVRLARMVLSIAGLSEGGALESRGLALLGWARSRVGSFDEGEGLLRRARSLARGAGLVDVACFAEVQLAHVARFRGDDVGAKTSLEAALAYLGPPDRGESEGRRAVRELVLDETVGAAIAVADREELERVTAAKLALARTRREQLAALLVRSEAHVYLGERDAMCEWLARAVKLADAAGPPEARLLRYLQGHRAWLAGAWEEAQAQFEQAAHHAEAHGNLGFVLSCRGRLADILRARGRLKEAREAFEALLEAHGRRGNGHGGAASRCNLALIALAEHRVEDADVLLIEAEDATEDGSVMGSFVQVLTAIVAARLDDPEGAAAALARVAHPTVVAGDEEVAAGLRAMRDRRSDVGWEGVDRALHAWATLL